MNGLAANLWKAGEIEVETETEKGNDRRDEDNIQTHASGEVGQEGVVERCLRGGA
jgi:hypothetical protein